MIKNILSNTIIQIHKWGRGCAYRSILKWNSVHSFDPSLYSAYWRKKLNNAEKLMPSYIVMPHDILWLLDYKKWIISFSIQMPFLPVIQLENRISLFICYCVWFGGAYGIIMNLLETILKNISRMRTLLSWCEQATFQYILPFIGNLQSKYISKLTSMTVLWRALPKNLFII